MEILDDPVRALDEVARLIGARGRVLPMACEPLDIEAEVTGLEDDDPHRAHRIRGQVAVASTPGRVSRKVSPRRAASVQWYHGLCRGEGFMERPPPTFIMWGSTYFIPR